MPTWTDEELDRIGAEDELRIASRRKDGTLRKLVIIWVVRLGDDLYVRSVNGRSGAWFRGTQVCNEGTIEAGGIRKEVSFMEADAELSELIDTAYRTKYHRYGATIVNSILTPQARSATIKLVPR